MTGKRTTMSVLRGASGLAGAHDVPAHPSHRPCGRDGLGNEPSPLSAKLAFLEAGPGTGLLCCPGQIGEAHTNRAIPTKVGTAFVVHRVRGAPRRHFFAPKVLGRSAQGKLRTAKCRPGMTDGREPGGVRDLVVLHNHHLILADSASVERIGVSAMDAGERKQSKD